MKELLKKTLTKKGLGSHIINCLFILEKQISSEFCPAMEPFSCDHFVHKMTISNIYYYYLFNKETRKAREIYHMLRKNNESS